MKVSKTNSLLDSTRTTRRDFLKSCAVASLSAALLADDSLFAAEERKFHNPIIEGACADPECLFSRKTGRVYVYPTSSGGFRAWSSDNLVDWKYEGFVLAAKDIHWERSKFWAPSIMEKQVGENEYKYYFYYCANEKLGVAVGDDPTGPFTDAGEIVGHDLHPQGRPGVEIDPFAFHDPVSGKDYLYWGNSYLCVAELNDDYTSINRETIKDITPPNFFEGTYVFYRNDRYYLTWSKNDTRDPNYQVWVATSDSPLGPFVSPEKDPIILSKRPEKNILGPGHHSFLFLPNGENYIFYHRIIQPQTPGGWGRETCLDRFEFASDGSIPPIEPTLEGVSTPVDLKSMVPR